MIVLPDFTKSFSVKHNPWLSWGFDSPFIECIFTSHRLDEIIAIHNGVWGNKALHKILNRERIVLDRTLLND